jgi:hypothetical protein
MVLGVLLKTRGWSRDTITDHRDQKGVNKKPSPLRTESLLEGFVSAALATVLAVGLAAGGFLLVDRPPPTAGDQAKTTA